MTPTGYVAGRVTVTAVATSLLDLIRNQLDKACPGTPTGMTITADGANAGPVSFGARSSTGGVLTAANSGFSLAANESKSYTSSYPGANVPLGSMQVLGTTGSIIHVEVW